MQYGDIMRYMVIAAVVTSAPIFAFCFLLPNVKLSYVNHVQIMNPI